MRVREPEPAERPGQLERALGIVLVAPLERRPQVVVVELEARRPLLFRLEPMRVRVLGELREVVGVTAVPLVAFELLARELADRLEQQEAVVADRLQQTEVDERRERVEVGVADVLRGFEREAAGEDGEAGEQLLRLLREQVVAPLDRRAERPLAFRRVARAAGEQRQRALQAREQRLRREQLRPRGGELQRERQTVEPPADRIHRRVRLERAADRAGSFDEERHRLVRRERVERILALAREAQRRAARDEDAELARRGEQRGESLGGGEQVLEVVEREQQPLAAQVLDQVLARADGLRDLRQHELRVGYACQRHPVDGVELLPDELGRDLEREPRLPGAAGARDRDEALPVLEHPDELVQLALAAEQRARRDRQVRRVERAQRRELALAELVELLRAPEVLEAVQAEVGQRNAVDERARSLRDDDLAAVRGAHHPRRAVDVDADVALVGDDRLTRVDPDPHLHRTVAERLLRFSRGRDGVSRADERDEERVALRVDLDPFVTTEHVAQGSPVLGKQRHVARPVLVQQPRRALDVGEEERDRSSRELGHRRVKAYGSNSEGSRAAGCPRILPRSVRPVARAVRAEPQRRPGRVERGDDVVALRVRRGHAAEVGRQRRLRRVLRDEVGHDRVVLCLAASKTVSSTALSPSSSRTDWITPATPSGASRTSNASVAVEVWMPSFTGVPLGADPVEADRREAARVPERRGVVHRREELALGHRLDRQR